MLHIVLYCPILPKIVLYYHKLPCIAKMSKGGLKQNQALLKGHTTNNKLPELYCALAGQTRGGTVHRKKETWRMTHPALCLLALDLQLRCWLHRWSHACSSPMSIHRYLHRYLFCVNSRNLWPTWIEQKMNTLKLQQEDLMNHRKSMLDFSLS